MRPLELQRVAGELEPHFLVDGMLIKLGRYLRVLGYDATWHRDEHGLALAERAAFEQRLFITRNQRLLHQGPLPGTVLLLDATEPVAQLFELRRRTRIGDKASFTRCIRCNTELDELPPGAQPPDAPSGVRRRYHRFFRCPACHSVFWRGTHVRNTMNKIGNT